MKFGNSVLSVSLICLSLATLITACGDEKEKTNSVLQREIFQNETNQSRENQKSSSKKGALLFQFSESEEVLAQKRKDYRETQQLKDLDLPEALNGIGAKVERRKIYTLGTPRNLENRGAPQAPIVHNYEFKSDNEPAAFVAISLPKEFYKNIPHKIQDAISHYDVEQLDLNIVIQVATPGSTLPHDRLYPKSTLNNIHPDHMADAWATAKSPAKATEPVTEDSYSYPSVGVFRTKFPEFGNKFGAYFFEIEDEIKMMINAWVGKASLKPHYWAYPNMPKLTSIKGSVYYEDILMGIFDSDKSIDDDLKSDELKSFPISVHDGRLSADVAHLNLEVKDLNVSFWSVVISEKQARAAVTLHWIVDNATYSSLECFMMSFGFLNQNGQGASLFNFASGSGTGVYDDLFNNPKSQSFSNKMKSLVLN